MAAVNGLATDQTRLEITLRVYDYAHVTPEALAGAEREANRILGTAGIGAVWLNCSESRGHFQSVPSPDCARQFGGETVKVRILPDSNPAKSAFPDTTILGFAEGGTIASVFYGRITHFAAWVDGGESGIPIILGGAITHELGHLLLGSNSHSVTGIMCAQWNRSYLQEALMGRQLFTPQQAKVIRAEVDRRNHIEVAEPLGRPQEAPLTDAPVTQPARGIQPTLTLRVYNYAHLDPGILTSAEKVTTSILKNAGAVTVWVECPLSSADFERYPGCHQGMQTTDFVIRLLPARQWHRS
jgi:hypothetical protein